MSRIDIVFALEEIEEGGGFFVEVIIVTVVEGGDAAYWASPFVHRTASLVSEKESGAGMLVKRIPLRVKPEAFVHLQRRHPLRNIPVNGEWQGEEILYLFFVREVDLGDVHKKCDGTHRASEPSHSKIYMDFARSTICVRKTCAS
jgi:hypothetical protein